MIAFTLFYYIERDRYLPGAGGDGATGLQPNALQHPPTIHRAVTTRRTEPGVVERFLADLRWSVVYVQAHPEARGEIAPIYGLAAALPFRGVVRALLHRYLGVCYEVEP